MLNSKMYNPNSTRSPRVLFNHGYHDAANDKANGRPRQLSETTHDVTHVSPTFDPMYFAGYKAGLDETNYTGNSQAAWEAFRGTLTEGQTAEIFRAEVMAHEAIWKKSERNARIRAQGIKYAEEITGRKYQDFSSVIGA